VESDPRVLVTGAGGQVGLALRRIAPNYTYLSRIELDVTDAVRVRAALTQAEVIIHLAAMTNVDRCEVDRDRAWLVNAIGSENVASVAKATGAQLIHVSTDYVFDGQQNTPYLEGDSPNPLNFYGITKLHGERAINEGNYNLIIRTSWVFGEGRNFIRTILDHAMKASKLSVVDDQIGRPTHARSVAEAIQAAIRMKLSGYLHIAGEGTPCSWADLATEALRVAGIRASVRRLSTSEYTALAGRKLAPRPAYSVLCLELARSLGVPLFDWKESLAAYVEEI
jgi:dTDP-4-dehydrorhamnose reductase